ncbi:mitochondrial inner membrane citrate transporter [Mollisia scopiformis]|uniref:Mitochondrial inner membrane citrate transporter n=1 Tax=Mollisia scopiformis TaxID=149040 RepID=A0A132B6A3_MOLSC|nr:mitochondrial inner membrane citrate transporter [Mollisia scopiformis]KUJ07783.1 mitochondrial inner membrane citrate transporter [Mollisia scopiformis]
MSLEEVQKVAPPPWKSLVAGCAAGAVEGLVTYPFEFAKAMLQFAPNAKNSPSTAMVCHAFSILLSLSVVSNPFVLVYKTAAERGIPALYVGCSTVVLGTALKASVRFLAFDSIRGVFEDEQKRLSGGRALLAAMSAGVMESVLVVTPFETVKTALIEDAKRARPQYRGMIHGTISLIKETGIGGVYRGVSAVTMRQVSVSFARMLSFSSMKAILQSGQTDQNANLGRGTTFAIGALAGVFTVYSTMPFDTVKTRMQTLEAKSQYTSTVDCALKMLKNEGASVFWRGSTARLGRIVVGSSFFFLWIER